MNSTSRIILAVVAALVLGSCGGDVADEPGGTPTGDGETTQGEAADGGTGSEQDLVQAVNGQFDAFVAQDGEAWFGTLSRACRERLGFAAVDSWFDGRHFNIDLAGIDLRALSVSDVIVTGGGSDAQVTMELSGTTERFREMLPHRWVFEDGGWFMDSCDDINQGQGQLEGFGTDRNDPAGFGGVIDANGWLIALRHIEPDGEELLLEFGASPATAGNQLFYVEVSIQYNGAEPSIVLGDELDFALLNGDTVYDGDAGCGSDDPVFLDPAGEYRPGGDGTFPWVCHEIPSEHATGMMLRVTHLPTGDTWWYRLDGT